MTIALIQANNGDGTTATVAPSFSAPTTAGSLVVLALAGDDYASPSGDWQEPPNAAQETFHGAYLWWQITPGGETTLDSYTIGSIGTSAWVVAEFAGLDPLPVDGSAGQAVASSGDSYATPSVTPTAGERLLLALFGGSAGASAADMSLPYTSWTNSFAEVDTGFHNAANKLCVGLGYRIVAADGLTSYSAGVNFPDTVQSRSGILVAFEAPTAVYNDGFWGVHAGVQ